MNHDQTLFLNRFATILEMEPSALDMDTPLASLESWDSLSALGVIAMLDKDYGCIVSLEGLRAAKSPRDILELARS